MPSSNSHISDAVRADLGKLDQSHRAGIRRVASTYGGSSAAGANTPVSAIDMDKKIGPSRKVSRPSREPPPR
jgi:hypothetical protein